MKNWKKREQISKIDQLKRTGERQVEAPLKGGFSRCLFRRRRRRPPQVFFAGARAAGPGFKPGQKKWFIYLYAPKVGKLLFQG